MTLSDAIILGRMKAPRAFKSFLRDGGTCDAGAALDAIGELSLYGNHPRGGEYFPVAREERPFPCGCPSSRKKSAIWIVIQHLNDFHGTAPPDSPQYWSTERVAGWVAQVEREEEAKQVEQVQADAVEVGP